MNSDTRLHSEALVRQLHNLSVAEPASSKSLPARIVDFDDIREEDDDDQEQEQEDATDLEREEREEQDKETEQARRSHTQELPSKYTFATSASTSRPPNQRRVTDPMTAVVNNLTPPLHLRPAAPVMGRSRNRSPYSRSHLRSRSSSSNSSSGYPMTRAYSSPLADTLSTLPELHPLPTPISSQQIRPASPLDSPYPRRASPRRSLEEPFMFSQSEMGTPSVPTIEENAELSLPSPTPTIPEDGIVPASPQPIHSTFPRSRRRPASPLYSFAQPARAASPGHRILHTSMSTPMLSQTHAQGSTVSSPNALSASSPASKYNEAFPAAQTPTTATATLSSASSMYSLSMSSSAYSGSMPSTPTSLRSRSPSISSLGTIPDSPDAEEEAMERERQDAQERLERLEKLHKVVGDREGEDLGRRMLGGGRERKRWSVCGAERRGDLEMETIWED